MQSSWYAWLVLVIGILLVLPKIGISALGDLTTGLISWVIPLAIIIIGVVGLMKVYGK